MSQSVAAVPLGCTAVIFTSSRSGSDEPEYQTMAARMDVLAAAQPGFITVESARSVDGVGVTVSYWADAEAAHDWGRVAEHQGVQELGRRRWYAWYRVRVASVTSDHGFDPAD